VHVLKREKESWVKYVSVADIDDPSFSVQYITVVGKGTRFILDRLVIVKGAKKSILVPETVIQPNAKLVPSKSITACSSVVREMVPARALVRRRP
jgi:hypothetical protein